MRYKLDQHLIDKKFAALPQKSKYGWTVKVRKNGIEYLVDEDANVIAEWLQIWNFMEKGYAAVLTLNGKSKYVTRNFVERDADSQLKSDKLFADKEWKSIMKVFDNVITNKVISVLYDDAIKKTTRLLKALEYECRFRMTKYENGTAEQQYFAERQSWLENCGVKIINWLMKKQLYQKEKNNQN